MGSFCRSSPQTTTQQQTQTYTPAPQIMGAGTQALTAAQQAAGQPFQMPAAPVAGFSPLQQQYFSGVSGMQGMAQPYFATGQQYLQGSAAPISGADISQYYNPMAANITAQMENIFGQQMRQMTGSATQQAGGAGADRIAVAQAELANQQGLAAGQTYAGLYQQALQAAEQQKQMMAGAGYGIAQMGPAAQTAQLQGVGALGAAGGQQQQLTQAQMNALYQQQLAQIAYPFQTAQYLAGITGALAPGMGGITTGAGTGTLTPPQPSPFAQILGGATAGAGLLTGLGGLTGGGTSAGTIGGTGLAGSGGLYDRGGKVINLDRSEYQEGGGAFDPTEQAGPQGQNRFSMLEETMPNMSVMGTPMPSGRPMSIKAEPIPTTPLMRDPRMPSQVGAMQMNMPQQQQQQSGGSGFGDVLKLAANVIPFFLKRGGKIELDAMGGAVGPMDVGRGFATDDDPVDIIENRFPQAGDIRAGTDVMGDPAAAQALLKARGESHLPIPLPTPRPNIPSPMPSDIQIADTSPMQTDEELPAGATPTQYKSPMGGNADLNVGTFTMPQSQLPYPDATKRDWGQDLTRSPWMSLVAAGARMMQTPGPIGSVIGAGLGAGAQELGAQRKALQSEEEINLKAQQLYQQSQEHLLDWTRMKPAQEAEIKLRERPYEEMTASEKETHRIQQEGLNLRKQMYSAGSIDDETLDDMAKSYRAGNTTVLQNLGRGVQGPVNIARFWNRLEQQLKDAGADGKDLAAAKANFMGQTAAARTAGVRGANIDMAVEEAKNTFPLALQASEALPRTDFVPWNQLVQMVRNKTSSPEQSRFYAANQAVITAYAQAMSRANVATVHSQERAEGLLSTVTSPESYAAVIDQMGKEMHAAQLAPDAVKANIESKITGRPAAAVTPTTTTTQPPGTSGFTGRTATGPNNTKLRETSDGRWVP